MAETTTYTGTLVICRCANCYMTWAVPEKFRQDKKRDHETFYCPAGHENYFPQESDLEKLRRELEAKENERRAAENSKEFWRKSTEAQERKTAAAKGAKTRVLNRIKNGVCPHCNRQFRNLHKHMESKHKAKERK